MAIRRLVKGEGKALNSAIKGAWRETDEENCPRADRKNGNLYFLFREETDLDIHTHIYILMWMPVFVTFMLMPGVSKPFFEVQYYTGSISDAAAL